MIKPWSIHELQQLYFDDCGKPLSDEQALDLAKRIAVFISHSTPRTGKPDIPLTENESLALNLIRKNEEKGIRTSLRAIADVLPLEFRTVFSLDFYLS